MSTQNLSVVSSRPVVRTVSQALRRIKALKGLMAEHTARAEQCVSYVAGTKPVFSFADQRSLRAAAQDEMVRLESAVAVANATHRVEVDGRQMTIAEAIRRLQELKADMAWLGKLPIREGISHEVESEWDDATGRSVRRTRDIAHATDLKETDRVSQVQQLRDQFERLNDAVEAANHVTHVELEEATPPLAS